MRSIFLRISHWRIKSAGTGIYRRVKDWREAVLTKIESAQRESARWRLLGTILKIPYSLLRTMGFSPRMAVTLLFAGASVGGGVVVEATVLSGYSFSRGDPGVYLAPSDAPIMYSQDDHTLRVDLNSDVPVGAITIESVTIGSIPSGSTVPAGEVNVVEIGGLSSVGTYLEVGHLIIDRWRCTTLVLKDMEIFQLNVLYMAADGLSIAPVAGVIRNRGIGGGNRADEMSTEFGTYDLLRVRAPTSGKNGMVDVLKLSNIYTKGGGCLVHRIKAGTVDVMFGEIGAGDGFGTKDFQIQDTVSVTNFVSIGNTEVSISPP
jgi:hypothetical protein